MLFLFRYTLFYIFTFFGGGEEAHSKSVAWGNFLEMLKPGKEIKFIKSAWLVLGFTGLRPGLDLRLL